MSEKLASMGFQSSMADPDVWLRAATKSDGDMYYDYVMMYVDDILTLSCDARAILEEIRSTRQNRVAGLLPWSEVAEETDQRHQVLDNSKPRLCQGCSEEC